MCRTCLAGSAHFFNIINIIHTFYAPFYSFISSSTQSSRDIISYPHYNAEAKIVLSFILYFILLSLKITKYIQLIFFSRNDSTLLKKSIRLYRFINSVFIIDNIKLLLCSDDNNAIRYPCRFKYIVSGGYFIGSSPQLK